MITAREKNVLAYLKRMYTNEEIADILKVSQYRIGTIARDLKRNGSWKPKEEVAEVIKKIQVLIIDGKSQEQIIEELGKQGISVNFIKEIYRTLKEENDKKSKKTIEREANEQILALILKGKTLEQIIKELESKSISIEFIEDNYKKIINNPDYLKKLKEEESYKKAIKMAQSGKYTLEQIITECGNFRGYKCQRIKDEIIYGMYKNRGTIDEISEATGLNAHYIGETIGGWEESKGNIGDSIVKEESKSKGATSNKTDKKNELNSDDRRKAVLNLVVKGKATEEDLDFLFRNVTEETDNYSTIVYTINVLMVWGHLALAKRIIDKRLSYDDCDPKLKEKLNSLKELIIKKMTTNRSNEEFYR